MATRTIGDIQKSNGNALTGDSITVTNADTRQSGQNSEKNELNELGQKIFLDRYAVKDAKKRTLAVGDLVIVIVDDKSGQREIGTVIAYDPTASGGAGKVSVELKDGVVVERMTEHVSKPIETSPEQMMERVARGIAAIEGEKADEWYEKFRWLLNGWKFVPAGRILTAAGTDQQLTFYNCYVVPSPKDSRMGIVDTLSQMMEIMSRGGGVGINISSLRPRHSYVKGVNGRSSGSVSWGALYSFVTGLIEQGGCLTPETLVFTEDGLLRLDEIVRHQHKGWREHEMAIMTDEGERLSRQVYNNGVADVLRVKTNVGIEITGTANHKVKVMTDSGTAWRQLEELQRGDAILVKLGQHTGKVRSLQKPESKHHNQDLVDLPTVLDEDLAFFLGYFAGDGFMTNRDGDWRLGVAVAHNSYLMAEMPRLIQRLFPGVNLRVQQKENDASLIYLISNRLIKEFLRLNGFDKSKSTEARVPRLIRQSPPSVVGAYLRGLFEADGGISHGYPMLISASKQLLDEVATLLIGLGCPVKIELQPMGENHFGNHPLWRLRIHSFKGLENWKTKIGCDDDSRFAACAAFTPDLTREVSYRLPNAAYWVEPVLTATALPQIDQRATGQRISSTDMALRKKLLRYQRGDRHLTLSAYTTLSRAHTAFAENAPDLNDTWFVYVENVEKAGTSPTLDIEVDDNHTYLANGLVTHNSRRGALMLILNCWHPDVLEFINAKRDMGKINNANVSVGITDKFMEAVRADADWDLVFPDSSTPDFERLWDGNLDKWINAGHPVITYKTVKARDVWNAIIESAWASAEPGVFFIDRANKDSNSWYYDAGYLACTNPCVTGDTLVSTPTGWKRVDQIQEGERIATILGQGEVETVETHTRVPVFKVTLSDGAVIRATAAHRFHAILASECPSDKAANKHFSTPRLDELKVGDYIRIAPALMPDRDVPGKPAMWMDREYGFAIGILLGDGCYTENNLLRNTVTISCDARETEWTAIVASLMTRAGTSIITRYQNRDRKGRITNSLSLSSQGRHGLAEFIGNTLLSPVKSGEKDVPLDYINTNKDFLAGLLDGLWSTDGNVSLKSTHPLLRFKTSSEKLAQSVRRILLMFGIHGRIVSGFRKQHEINGRRIKTSNPYYELIISGAGVKAFAEQIGITHPDKAEKLKQAQLEFALTGNTWLATIKSIEADGEERVYDLYEPVSDTWITEGIVNRGCGEQPIPGWAVCNLGAINLSKFVQDGEVTWDELGKAVRYSVRFLDNVIDATPYFFEENYRQQKNERRVGLNTMGLAEMMIRLGIRYGSEESTRFIDRLYRFISSNAYQASAEIAAEKGAFPEFDAEKFLQSGYMQRMPEDVRQTVREKGIRNVTLLTQAPNGCVTPDTLVFADGALRPIATLGDADGEQWQDVSFTTHSDSGAKAVDKLYVNGFKEVVEITTARGFKLAATLQHRIRVVDAEGNYEWRQMGEILPGDTVVMGRGGLGQAAAPRLEAITTKKRRSTLKLPETLTPELAELLGFYIGDGYLKDRRGLGIAVDARDTDVVGRLQALIGQAFNLDAKVEDTGRNCLLVWAASYFIPRWLRANELAKTSAYDAKIPEAILAGGAATVSAFLRGLFESDGSISNGIVTLVSASERLAREVQVALLGLDIVSTRRSLEPGEGRYGTSIRYEVRLLNSAEVLRFRERVGFVSCRKQERLNACEDKGGRADSIPASLLRKLYTESEGLPTGVRQEIASAIRSGMTQEKWRSLANANPALGNLPSAYLLDAALFFDTAADVSLSESLTFDLSVPETNTYIANGLIAHNTIGTMVGTSTGIEPFYFWSYLRKSRLGQHEERVKVLEEWQQAHPGEPLPDYFVTAMDLTPKEHVQVQAAIQRWVDSAISKTCNLPSSYSVEQTRELYEMMYKLGCKGGTIYRDGSRDVQVLNLKEEDKKVSEQTEKVETPAPSTVQEQTGTTEAQPVTAVQPALFTQLDGGTKPKIRPRPYKRRGYTVSKNTPSGTAHITMNEDEEGQPFEVFVEIGKAGSDIKAMAEAMGRLMSLLLRIESPISPTERVQEIVKQITGIGGARSYGFGKRRVLSLPDAVGQALAENYLGVTSGTEQDNQGSEMGVSEALALLEEGGNAEAAQAIANSEIAKKLLTKAASGAAADICPNCGDSAFIRVEGCQTCYACGYSEC
jgi:ribonucleotide reductase alpha subunit